MSVHPTGFSGEAVVPCSHCNANEEGPEAGIVGTLVRNTVMVATGHANQVLCRFYHGKGYVKV